MPFGVFKDFLEKAYLFLFERAAEKEGEGEGESALFVHGIPLQMPAAAASGPGWGWERGTQFPLSCAWRSLVLTAAPQDAR